MSAVRRGAAVRWSVTTHTGAGTFTRGRPTTTEYVGTVLDQGPERGTWWVLPRGERNAVVVPTKELQTVRVAP